MGFNTSDWFNSWYEDQGIETEEAKDAEYERIRNGGVLIDGATGSVKQHFSAWYHSKMKEKVASQFNKIEAAKRKNLLLNVDIEGEGNEGSEGGEGTDLLENITTEDELVNSIFSNPEAKSIDIINEGVKKFSKFLPEGLEFDQANFLDMYVIKLEDDPYGLAESLSGFGKGKYSLRFQTDSVTDKARFKKFVKIMKIIETKKYPQGFKPSADIGQTYKDLYDIL